MFEMIDDGDEFDGKCSMHDLMHGEFVKCQRPIYTMWDLDESAAFEEDGGKLFLCHKHHNEELKKDGQYKLYWQHKNSQVV